MSHLPLLNNAGKYQKGMKKQTYPEIRPEQSDWGKVRHENTTIKRKERGSIQDTF